MGIRFLSIGSNEDASCRRVREGCSRCLCHKSGRSEFEICGIGLEEGTCSINMRVFTRANHPPRSQ